MPKTLFIFGLGYVGSALACRALKLGYSIYGTTQSSRYNDEVLKLCPNINDLSIQRIAFDDVGAVNEAIAQATHVLISIPPREGRDHVFDLYSKQLLTSKNLEWIGYLSTTGVYGDYKGAWVDETSVCKPSHDRTKSRYKVEQEWLHSSLPVTIFRLSGIYGPFRNALEHLRQGRAQRILKQGHTFSRIHLEDIVAVLLKSMELSTSKEIYNLADDHPASSQEVIEYAAQLLGVEPPPLILFEEAKLSPMALSFYQDNRRVSNTKIKEKLGIHLRYPSFKEGLMSLNSQTCNGLT